MNPDIADTTDQDPPERDCGDMNEMMVHLDNQARKRARERAWKRVRTGQWLPERTFWDELVDVNCTPQGQEFENDYLGPWDSFYEAWYAAGAYLSEAMSLHEGVQTTDSEVTRDNSSEDRSEFREDQGSCPAGIQHEPYGSFLPPASDFAKYEEVRPGATDRIISLAENSLNIQEKALDKQAVLSGLKLIISGIVSVSLIAVAAMAIVHGSAWLSVPLVSVGILTLFVRKLITRWKDR